MRHLTARAAIGVAFASLLALESGALLGSDARDAPTIGQYSGVDLGGLYMFRDPPNSTGGPGSNLVVALTTQPLADPMFGPTYHFQENALYRINFTTMANARPTASIDINFGRFTTSPDCPDPARPCQMFRATFPDGTTLTGPVTEGTYGPTHLPPVVTSGSGYKVFAGPRQDPFFFDFVGFNRTVESSPAAILFTGVDAFLSKNVQAIVVELPLDLVFPAGSCRLTPPFSTPCGAWAVTYLGNLRPNNPNADPNPASALQVDRVGNPLVNAALIPGGLNDAFNFGQPKDDPKDFGAVMLDRILALDVKFGTCQGGNTSAPAACNPNVPLLSSILIPDILRFASDANDGYPNGRRPTDRTTDLLLSLILNVPGFTDGTSTKTGCPGFPFLRPPLQLGAAPPFDFDSNPQSCP